MRLGPAGVAQLGLLLASAVAAVVLARPERVPADLAPPPRSAASQAPDRAPAPGNEVEPSAEGESAGTEAADEPPPPGRALTRQDLETGLLKVRAHALGCRAEGPPPVVELRIAIAPSGQVTSVGLPADVKGTRAGDCIARAVRAASFPSWTAPPVPQVEWTYPLRFDAAE